MFNGLTPFGALAAQGPFWGGRRGGLRPGLKEILGQQMGRHYLELPPMLRKDLG